MTTWTTPLEGTNGNPLGQNNHGGNAFTAAPTGTSTFTTARSAHGSSSLVTTATGAAWWDTSASNTKIFARGYIMVPNAIAGDTTVFTGYYASGSQAFRLIIQGTNRFRFNAYGGAGTLSTKWTASAALPTNTWIRWQLLADPGTSATTGTARVAYYTLDSDTPIEDTNVTALANMSNIDLAGTAGTFTQGRFATATTLYQDDWGMRDGVDAVWVNQWVPSAPPVINVVEGAGWFKADYRPSTAAGTKTYGIVHTSGPNNLASSDNPAPGLWYIPQDASATSTYTVTVTADSLSSTDVVSVPPASTGSSLGMEYLYCNGTAYV